MTRQRTKYETSQKATYQRRYLDKNPWAKNCAYSKSRAGKNGLTHTMSASDFKVLWFRDNAQEMVSPSIDRIDPKLGYVMENCRFLERSENCRLGATNNVPTQLRRDTAKNNIAGWNRHQIFKSNLGREIRQKMRSFANGEDDYCMGEYQALDDILSLLDELEK